MMQTANMAGIALWARWTSELALERRVQRHFLAWAQATDPDSWAKFAAARGKAADDPALVLDAAITAGDALNEAIGAHLDKLAAVIEARHFLEGDPPQGV